MRHLACLFTLLLLPLSGAALPFSSEVLREAASQDAEQVRAAFLAPEADSEDFKALASFPELLQERPLQIKLFRSLTSKKVEVFQAAVALCLRVPQATQFAMIRRRFNLSFIGPDVRKRQAILELALGETSFLKDLRLVSLVSEALSTPDPTLAETALSLVREEKWMQKLPAIAEALSRSGVNLGSPRLKLPDVAFFRARVAPIFEVEGKDEKACVDCHKGHPILRLKPVETDSEAEQTLDHYRASLRVIDLEQPENSLLLTKPLQEAPPEGTYASGANQHGGGVRWTRDSPEYRTLLEWIRTAKGKDLRKDGGHICLNFQVCEGVVSGCSLIHDNVEGSRRLGHLRHRSRRLDFQGRSDGTDQISLGCRLQGQSHLLFRHGLAE